MTNAKTELNNLLSRIKSPIKCASIVYSDSFKSDSAYCTLKIDYTTEELEIFMKSMDFEYYSGYGGQELFGTVWLNDGTWLSRGEYDGSEWWIHNKLPDIPQELLR
jgi:hypothetical protein